MALNDASEHGPAAGPLETTPHNGIHNFVGGDMGTLMSPLDPIFWTHHGRVDRLWVEWNILRNNPNTNDTAWTATEFTEFVDRKGHPARISVLTTVLLPLLSYRYDTQVESPTSPINPPEDDDELRKRLRKGAKVTLDQRSRFTVPKSAIDGTQPVTLQVPGGENLAGKMSELGNGGTARVSLEFSYMSTTSFAVLVFINSPNGNEKTATEDPGFVGIRELLRRPDGDGPQQNSDVPIICDERGQSQRAWTARSHPGPGVTLGAPTRGAGERRGDHLRRLAHLNRRSPPVNSCS